MKRTAIFVFGLLFSVASVATGGIAGYEAGAAGDGKASTVFTCQMQDSGVVLTIENLVLVRLAREGQMPAGAVADKNEAGKDVFRLRYEDNPSVFNGGTMYAVALGKDWAGKGPNIETVDLSRNIGSAQVTGNKISLSISVKSGAEWQALTLIYEGSLGRAWGGVEGQGYQARNKNNAPLLLIGVEGKERSGKPCMQPTQEVLKAMRELP